jgi:hypothetical protein
MGVDFGRENGVGAMSKILMIICSLVLAFGVAGCAGKGKAPPPVVTKG